MATGIQDAAGRQKILEGLWLIGIEPTQLQNVDPNRDPNAFLDQLHANGVNDDFIRRAVAGVDWRAPDDKTPTAQRVADLLSASGYRPDEIDRFTKTVQDTGATSPDEIMGVLASQFNDRTAGAMIYKATGGRDVQGAVWNPYRTDLPPKNANVSYGSMGAQATQTVTTMPGTSAGTRVNQPAQLPTPPTPAQQAAQAAVASKPAAKPATAPAGGGGAVGGGGTVDTTQRLAPGASDADAMQFIREHYGFGAWIMQYPDVWNVIKAAAMDGHWSDARLNGALGATDFYKTHSGKTIEWMNTESNDPATASHQTDQKVNDVVTKAQAIGMTIDPQRARQIAHDALMFDWDDTQLTQAVGHEYHYNPTMAQKGIAKQVTDTARSYGIPMTDQGLDEWGRKLAAGDVSADDFKATLVNQAKSLFPTLSADLDRGMTVNDIFDPYRQLAAKTLGIDANTIDILDPKWQRPLQSTDGKNPTRMSTSDWYNTLRSDSTYGWDTTDNARQEAADFAHKLRAGFGLAPS